jgi:serine/threonine protein kinase
MGTAVVGTPLFLAPETIHEPKSASPKSDIYAIGVLLYYAATLKTPFFGDDAFQTLSRILSGQHPRVHDLRKDLPKPVADQIERAFAFDAAQRPESGGALEAAFLDLRHGIDPNADSQRELVAFLQQTDELNTFTVATAINVPSAEKQIATPQPVKPETTQVATIAARTQRPNDRQTVIDTVKALKSSGNETVVVLQTGENRVVSKHRAPVLIGVALAAVVAVALAVVLTRKKPASLPPPIVIDMQSSPEEPELPAPLPTEVVTVPQKVEPPPAPAPRPVVKKESSSPQGVTR